MPILYPSTAPVTLYPGSDLPDTYPVLNSSAGAATSVVRGLKSALLGVDAGTAAGDYWKARAAGDMPRAQANGLRAQQLLAETQQAAPRVQSVGDIHGWGDAADWGAGVIGSLPVSMAPALAGGLGGGMLGAALKVGGLGSMAGSMLGMQPQLRDAARAQQMQAELQGAPGMDPQQVLTDTDRQGMTQAGLEGIVPGLAARSVVGAGARTALTRPVSSAMQRVGRDVALDSGAAALSEGVATNYESGRNPGRDTSDDTMRYIDAAAGEAVGGGAFGALGHAGDVAHTMLGTGAQLTGDAAAYAARAGKQGVLAAGDAAKQAWNNRPKTLDEAAVMAGEGAANLHTKAEDAVTRLVQRGKDADVDTLLAKPKANDEATLRADDAAKHTAAANLIAKIAANPGAAPDYVHAAVEQYKQGSQMMDSWKTVADAVNDWKRSDGITTSLVKFGKELSLPIGEMAGKLHNSFDDAVDTYNGKRKLDGRANAQTPDMQFDIMASRDELSPLIDEALAPLTGLTSQDALDNALPSLNYGLRTWVENGFSMKKDGPPVVPSSLIGMFTDPAKAVQATVDLLHRQGLVDDKILPLRDRVLEQLKVKQLAREEAAVIVDEMMLPTQSHGLSAAQRRAVADDLMDRLPSDGVSTKEAKALFGPRARIALDAMRAKLNSKVQIEVETENGGTRTNSAYDEGDSDTSYEDMNQMTTAKAPSEDRADTKFYPYNPRTKEPYKVGGFSVDPETGEVLAHHDEKAPQRISELQTKNGSEVKRVGYMDYLREAHADDSSTLMGEAVKFIQSKESEIRAIADKYTAEGKKPPPPEGIVNKHWYVLKETVGGKGERANATAASLGREGNKGQIIGNEWAEDRTDGEYGTVKHGRIWLERKMSDGSVKPFATSASRIISRLSEARKSDGRSDESSGIAGQNTLLQQGLASLLTAAHAEAEPDSSIFAPSEKHQGVEAVWPPKKDARSVLTGRVGVKETANGEMKWLSSADELPASLRLYSTSGQTYGDAKNAAQGKRDDELLNEGRELLKRSMPPKWRKVLTRAIEKKDFKRIDAFVRASDQKREGEQGEDETRTVREHTYEGPFATMEDAYDARTDKGDAAVEREGGFYVRRTKSTQLLTGQIGADTHEVNRVATVTYITRDANKNIFGSKKAALAYAASLEETRNVTLRVVKESQSDLAKRGDASTRTGLSANRAKAHWVIERTDHGEEQTSSGLPTEISEMGKSSNVRSRQEDGVDTEPRNTDEATGRGLDEADAHGGSDGKLYKLTDRQALAARAAGETHKVDTRSYPVKTTPMHTRVIDSTRSRIDQRLAGHAQKVVVTTKAALNESFGRSEADGTLLLAQEAFTRTVPWAEFSQHDSAHVVLAHEAGHQLDRANGYFYSNSMNKTWTAANDLFKTLKKDDIMYKWLRQPLDTAYGKPKAEDARKRELFAQLVALHSFKPELLKKRFAAGFNLVEKAYATDGKTGNTRATGGVGESAGRVLGTDGRVGEAKPAATRATGASEGKLQGRVEAPKQTFSDVAKKMHSYLDNPPADFNVTQVKAIRDWATKQEARLNEAKSKHKEGSDEWERLDDLRFEATMLKAKATKAIKTEAEVEAHHAEQGGPRYNAMATRIHTDLGREGFAATHDSPIRHEGKFDWRSHQGKGEGNAAFGAGTYLSTADGVHKGYKGQFRGRVEFDEGLGNDAFKEVPKRLNAYFAKMSDHLAPDPVTRSNVSYVLQALRSHVERGTPLTHELKKTFPGGVTKGELAEMLPFLEKYGGDAKFGGGEAPTYEVSVGIKPEQMLDWNRPLSEQSALVQKALASELTSEPLRWSKRGSDEIGISPNGTTYKITEDSDVGGWFIVREDHKSLATVGDFDGYRNSAEAKLAAEHIATGAAKSGADVYEGLVKRLGSQAKASDYLQSLGILGHTYDAAGGRNDKFRNHVIYDDSKITTNYVHFNKQDPVYKAFGNTPREAATNAERVKFFTDISRRLGTGMKSVLEEELWGKTKSGKAIPLSGEWTEGLIKASVYAKNLDQIGAHESFHEFFSRLRDQPQAADVMKILDRAANSAPVLRQIERLLDGETNALKQIKDGAPHSAEERMAYMFQFWSAGLLKIGPETETVFQKIARVFRRIAGLMNEDEKADMLLRAFDKGEMQDADAAARVLANSATAREKLYAGVNKAFVPVMDKVSRAVNTAETNLERIGIKEYSEVRRLFKRSVGEDGQQGFLDAKDHMMKQKSNMLFKAFQDANGTPYHEKDLKLAAEYLHTGKKPTDPVVKDIVNKLTGPDGILPMMHKYLTDAGVQRWQDNGAGRGEWVPMGKIDHKYFPRVYDTAKILGDTSGFIEKFSKLNAAELNKIAAEQNELLASSGGKDFTPVTAVDVARAITNRLINSFGAGLEENASDLSIGAGKAALKESKGSVGFSPFMQAVNKRDLHWIHPEILKEYGEKDVAMIMTSYVAQGVKRAEYVRRFGNGGEVLRDRLKDAYEANVKRLVTGGMSADDAKLKALKTAKGAATDVMAMEGTLGYGINPKLRKFENSMLVYQNMRVLSTSLFSQFIDPLGLVIRGAPMREAWDSYKRGMREVVASIKGDPINDLDSMIADQVGTTDANGFLAQFGQLYSSQYMGATFRKANDVLFHYNGMEGFNRGMQVSATRSAINFIKRHVEKPNERSTEYLKELNLAPKDVKVDKDGELDYTDPRIQQAIHQWVNGAIMRPNAAQRPAWGSDPHYMVFWHMKQFAYTFHDVILKRAQHEYKKFGDMGPAGLLAMGYAPVMIATDAMKGLILSGGEEPGWMRAGLGSEIHHGAMRAGLAGKFQPGLDVMGPNRSVLGLGGPMVEQLTQMFNQAPGDATVNALPGANVWNTMRGGNMVEMQGED